MMKLIKGISDASGVVDDLIYHGVGRVFDLFALDTGILFDQDAVRFTRREGPRKDQPVASSEEVWQKTKPVFTN